MSFSIWLLTMPCDAPKAICKMYFFMRTRSSSGVSEPYRALRPPTGGRPSPELWGFGHPRCPRCLPLARRPTARLRSAPARFRVSSVVGVVEEGRCLWLLPRSELEAVVVAVEYPCFKVSYPVGGGGIDPGGGGITGVACEPDVDWLVLNLILPIGSSLLSVVSGWFRSFSISRLWRLFLRRILDHIVQLLLQQLNEDLSSAYFVFGIVQLILDGNRGSA